MIQLGGAVIYNGDCLEILRGLPDNSVDSIVTDPPYGLGKEPDALAMLQDWLTTGHHEVKGTGFMGKKWDAFVPQPVVWRECLRVIKPGGYLLSFGGTRTYDLVVLGLRIAGWEIRDQINWVYGSGFPKSLDVSKAIDAAMGAEGAYGGPKSAAHAGWIDRGRMRGEEGHEGYQRPWMADTVAVDRNARAYLPATDQARQWEGWGTALKPAHEPIVVARKPLIGTVAANVLAWGTGGLNIDGCRVGAGELISGGGCNFDSWRGAEGRGDRPARHGVRDEGHTLGRFPANLIHDGSPEVLACFPDAPGQVTGDEPTANGFSGAVKYSGMRERIASAAPRLELDKSAARFFYCAKSSKQDRGPGNDHPTVKPQALMRYLCRLVTPPSGVVLDPYAGSGSTGVAAITEEFQPVLIEADPHSYNITLGRVAVAVMEAAK